MDAFSSAASLIRLMKNGVAALNSCGSTRKMSSPGLAEVPFTQPLGEPGSTARVARSAMSTLILSSTLAPARLLKMMSSLTFSAPSPATRQTIRAIEPLLMSRAMFGIPISKVRMRYRVVSMRLLKPRLVV